MKFVQLTRGGDVHFRVPDIFSCSEFSYLPYTKHPTIGMWQNLGRLKHYLRVILFRVVASVPVDAGGDYTIQFNISSA